MLTPQLVAWAELAELAAMALLPPPLGMAVLAVLVVLAKGAVFSAPAPPFPLLIPL
jgi:hypothetical protein